VGGLSAGSAALDRSLLRATLHQARTWLGPSAKRLWFAPVFGLAMAASEAGMLVIIVRTLLAYAEGLDTISLGGSNGVELSFAGAVVVGVALGAISATLRVLEAGYIARLITVAVQRATTRTIEVHFDSPWEVQGSQRSGELQRRVGTEAQQAAMPVIALTVGVSAVVTLLAYLAAVLVSAPLLVAVGVVLGGALVVAFKPLRNRHKLMARAYAQRLSSLQLDAATYASLHKELELYGVQQPVIATLSESSRLNAAAFGRTRFYMRMLAPVYQIALLTGLLVIVAVSRAADLSAVGVGTAALLLVRALSYIQQITAAAQVATEALPHLEALEAAHHTQGASRRARGGRQLDGVHSIELDGVTFAYDTEPVVRDVALRLDAGDRVGLVGPSGGGKTTLASLVAGLLTPTAGRVLVNGAPLTEFDPSSWASAVALLDQDASLLRASIADNVRLHRQASDEAVADALHRSALERDLRDLPDGQRTRVGDGYQRLSGGQRQRVAIARALLGEPSLLILDEPSSALDAETERSIDRTLADLPPETIVVIVSHRPLLLRRCTRVLTVRDGSIEEAVAEQDDRPRSRLA
jgi:ABC-type multidrug transport system fused ATPase/permease subunit